MIEIIQKLRDCFVGLGEEYLENCLIEIEDKKDEFVLFANKEGILCLINHLIGLCEQNKEWSHYHLDEAGMANKCNKPMVISLVK